MINEHDIEAFSESAEGRKKEAFKGIPEVSKHEVSQTKVSEKRIQTSDTSTTARPEPGSLRGVTEADGKWEIEINLALTGYNSLHATAWFRRNKTGDAQ